MGDLDTALNRKLTVYACLDSMTAQLVAAEILRMNLLQDHGPLPKQLEGACREIEKIAEAPCLVFILDDPRHYISYSIYETLFKNEDRLNCAGNGNLSLIISSYGGDLHAAYKIATLLRARCKSLKAFVPYVAKSAATFLCLAADEIILSERAELGPLDSQHASPQDPEKVVSALESFKALDSIRRFAFETLDRAMVHFPIRGGFTMMESLPHVTKFVGTIIDPLFRSFDVHKLGEYGRSLEVAEDYGVRVMKKFGYKELSREELAQMVGKLIWKYPSHGQVIDLDECKQVGLKVRAANEAEEMALRKISLSLSDIVYVGMLPPVGGKDERQEK